MASKLDQLNDLVQTMVAEKTLSLEGLAGIQKLKDMVAALETQVANKDTQIEQRDKRITSLEEQLSKVTEERNALKKVEDAIAHREARVFEVEKGAAVSQAQATAYRDAMAIVFAPNSVRERVLAFGGQQLPNGQYGGTNDDRTVTRTDGYKTPQTAGVPETDNQGNKQTL